MPWKKPKEVAKKGPGDFYKGAFDTIPFLNDDAKRTFQHLLLRPGYMIRDYINGQHERYLAPLTSLIIFYAFFALVAAVLQPVQHKHNPVAELDTMLNSGQDSVYVLNLGQDTLQISSGGSFVRSIAQIVKRGYILLHLDQYPEEVDTQRESSLAALEGVLRSQGIPLFITEFLFLWIAMCIALRRFKYPKSAYAAASAYVLCQFSFFMLFAVLLTWGKSSSISILLMTVLLVVDYHQWLDVGWTKSLKLTISTGLVFGLVYGAMILLVSLAVLALAWIKG